MNIPPIVLPKEHGAWAVLFIPMLAAALLTQTITPDFLLLVFSVLMIFMSYLPLHLIFRELSEQPRKSEISPRARFWASAYVSLGLLFALPVLSHGYSKLIPLGLVAAASLAGNFFLKGNSPKTIPSDLVAVFGLTLSGPASYYVLKGSYDVTAFVLWVMNFLFFGYCVFYVHMKIKASATKRPFLPLRERLHIGRHLIAYHLLAISILLWLILDHITPQFGFIAFLPMTVHALYGTLNLSGRVRFRNLGYALLAHSVLFGVLMGVFE